MSKAVERGPSEPKFLNSTMKQSFVVSLAKMQKRGIIRRRKNLTSCAFVDAIIKSTYVFLISF